MRRSVRAGIAAVVCFLVVPGVGAVGAARASAARPDFPLPAVRSFVPLPPSVDAVDECNWTRDGTALLCDFDLTNGQTQVGFMRPDGSHYHCLTCGTQLDGPPADVQAFADGKRFFFSFSAGKNSQGLAIRGGAIGECSPSLADCQQLTVSDLQVPTIPGDINDRAIKISPDGRHYAWTAVRSTDGFLMLMGDLVSTPSGYQVQNTRVLNGVPDPQSAAAWTERTAWYETKSFHGGQTLVFASSLAGGFNLDVWSLDLQTGGMTRLTKNLEWDEYGALDPTGRYLVIDSARRMHNQLRAPALAGVPGFLDAERVAAQNKPSVSTSALRAHTLETWLTTTGTEDSGGDGEMLNAGIDGGYYSAGDADVWSPQGNRLVMTVHPRSDPNGEGREVLVRVPSLHPQPPYCADPDREPSCQTPTPRWAPLLQNYPALPAGTYTIPGPGGGSATLSFAGSILGPLNSVQFNGYVGQDGRVFNGSAQFTGTAGKTVTAATDVTITGRHTGQTTEQSVAQGKDLCGTIDTTLDGRHLHTNVGEWNPDCGFSQPAICPDGADLDATPTGDCSQDRWPPAFAPPGTRGDALSGAWSSSR